MSFPVQIVIHGGRVRSTAEAVCRRLGGGPRGVAWPFSWDDQPELGGRLAAAARRMAEAQGDRGEGGYGQVVVADSADALAEVAAVLAAGPRPAHLWCRLAVVLDDAIGPDAAGAFDAVHLVPSAPGARRLADRDRVQVVGNLLGLTLEIARLEDGRRVMAELLDHYPGVWVSLAAVARFNAPAIRAVLAARLAATVAGRMRASIQKGQTGQTGEMGQTGYAARASEGEAFRTLDPLELPDALFAADALRRTALAVSGRVAASIRDGADDAHDVDALTAQIAAETRDDVARIGRSAMEAADALTRALRRGVDDALSGASFAALGPLRRDLAAFARDVGAALARCEISAGGLAPLVAPPTEPLVTARAALAAARASAASTGSLFGAWALIGAVAAGAILGPFLGDGGPALLAYLPGGAFTGAGLAALGASGVIAGLSRATHRRRLAALEQAVEAALARVRGAWAAAIDAHLGDVGRLLQRRALRHVADAIAREDALLAAVAAQVEELEERFRREGAAPEPLGQPFDVYVPVGAALYDAASLSAPPEVGFRRAEADLGQPGWRGELTFMDGEAFFESCRAAFDDFAERLPLDTRQDLRAAVAAPTRHALEGLARHLDRFVPPGEEAARLLVVPRSLADAVPTALEHQTRLWPGTSDLFCAVLQRPDHLAGSLHGAGGGS